MTLEGFAKGARLRRGARFRFPSVFVARRGHRRLPVERRWPQRYIALAQALLIVAAIGGWQAAASLKIIDPFFWSEPAAIWKTLQIFFLKGDAFTDIGYTFQATMLGFVIGTLAGSALGLSFWWSRNYAAVIQPFVICFESVPKLALAPLIILIFGMGLASKVAIAVALTVVVSTLTTYAGVQAIDPDSERLFYSLGASRLQAFLRAFLPLSLPGIVGAGLLVFIFSLGFFVTPAILGGGRTMMIAQYVSIQILESVRWGLGAMMAAVLMFAVLASIAVLARLVDFRRLFGAQ